MIEMTCFLKYVEDNLINLLFDVNRFVQFFFLKLFHKLVGVAGHNVENLKEFKE